MTDVGWPRQPIFSWPPFRTSFDAARDPLTARNAIGAVDAKYVTDAIAAAGGGGGGAPTTAEYITAAADPTLTAERVLTNTATVTWDFSTAGQAKANAATGGGGNVSNSGTPTVGQYAKWVTATTIQGVAPATVMSDIGAAPLASPTFTGDPKAPTPATADNDTSIATTAYVQAQGYLTAATAAATYQPLDADLTAIAALTGTNTIYYRSAANTWSPINVSTGLAFSGGNLTSTVTSGAPVGAEYITSTADATLTSERVLTDTATVTWDRTTAGQIKANAVGGGTATPVPPQGRLTLQTLTPVMITTQSAKTTIYYTPYVGNQIPLYNGTSMVPTTFAELSVATTDTTKSPAAIGASKVNDWFVWSDAGTLRVGHGPDWTSDTVRSAGTALVMVNGILLNNASITNGPAAQRGTYVGTTRSNASSQLDFIFGTRAANGGQGWIGVWNCYNRVPVHMFVQDTTSSVSFAPLTWISMFNQPTWRVYFANGLAEDPWLGRAEGTVTQSATGYAHIGIDLDGAKIGGSLAGTADYNATCQQLSATLIVSGSKGDIAPLGFHYVQAIILSSGGTCIWYGNSYSILNFDWRC